MRHFSFAFKIPVFLTLRQKFLHVRASLDFPVQTSAHRVNPSGNGGSGRVVRCML